MAYFEDIPAQDLSIFNQRAAEAESPKTGALRKLGDIGVAGARGAVTGVKLLSDAAGAGNPVSESLEGASKWLTGLESPARAAEKKARAEKIDAAEKSGSTWAEIAANLGGFFEAPVSSTVEALGTSAPTLLTAAIPGVGPAALAARGAATIGMGALQGAGSVKGQIYDTVKAEQLKGGMSPAEAEARALAAQEYFGKNAANIAAGSALGAAAGRFGLEGMLEKSLGGQGLAGGVARRAGTGVVTEGIPEAAQGGQERYASNVALQREGFDTPTFQGVAGNAAAEGIAGGALGGVGGALARPREEPPGIVPPAGLDAPPPIAPSGPLTRAAETAVGAQAGQNAAAAAAGVDPAMRLAELEQKATGTKDQKVPGPDGKPVTVPATPAQFLTDAEKAERDSLKGSVSEAAVGQAAQKTPAAMAADPLPAMHQAAADNLAAQKQFGGDRPGIPSTNAVVYQEPKPRDMPPAFEQPVTPGQIFESIEEIRARQQQDGEMLSGLVQPKNEIVPFRGKPPAIDEKTIDGDGLYRVIGEATAAAPDFADHTDLAGRAFAKNPRLTLEVLRDPRIDHEQETVVLRAITRGGNATAQYAKLALEAFQAKPPAAGAQPQAGGSTGVVPQGQEVGAAQPEPLARQEGETGVKESPPAAAGTAPAGEGVTAQPGAAQQPTVRLSSQEWVNQGKSPADLIVERSDSLGKELAAVITQEASGKDFAPNDLPTAVRNWADQNKVPADDLRQSVLKALGDFGLSEGRVRQIKQALSPIKTQIESPGTSPGQVESDSTRPLTIEPVSDTTMVIRGPGKHKDAIKAAGGSWNTPQKGWTFPKAREAQVRAALGDLVSRGSNKLSPPAPAEVKRGTVGMKLGADEVVLTNTGRKTRPFPKVATDTDRKARNTLKAIDSWLITNALEEASSRGDEFNRRQFQNSNPLNLSQSDKDSAEEYLFGDYIPPVVPSILKPLVPAKPAGDAPAAAPTKPKAAPKVDQRAVDRAAYFTPGNVVPSYGGHDRVISYKPSDANGGWSVTVESVVQQDGEWVKDPKDKGTRTHSTEPDARALKAGPMATGDTPAPDKVESDSTPKAAPTKNTIFTDEAYAAAKERMKARMNRLNSGVDPEMLFDGIVMAGHHIERGARTFAAYSKAMIAELGEGIRPYLKSFYMAIKYDPRAAAFAGEMDGEADIDKAGVDAPPAPAQNENSNGDTDVQPDRGAKDQGASQGDQGQGSPDQQGSAPADSEGVADGAPENVGGTPAPGTRKRPGAGGAGGNVGGQRPVRKSRDAADGRDGAGGTGVPDDGAGDGGRVTPPGQRANYHITDPEALIGGGPKARFEHNKKAIEAYQSITSEGREPTQEDLDAMAGYIGWGSFGQELFQGNFAAPAEKPGWVKEGAWLREHLGEAGWKSAQASIINAHYTDPITVEAMWDMVRQLGFKGGRVLEPSMGVGNFFGLMPRDLMAQSSLTGIEMEQTTGGMARILYPEANIQIKPYQDSKTADGFYDLVIGNWPFAKDGPADRRYMNLSPSLHDFFFLKALDQTRPGGLVVGITSAGTMDKKGTVTRAALAGKADLVAAFRLPSGAFEQYAGTSVVTDIIILKRRDTPGDARSSGFLNTVEVETKAGEKIDVNEYFSKNPGNVLGTLNWGHGSTYGRPSMIVERPADLERRLQAIAATLPAVYSPRTTAAKTIQYVTNNTTDRQQAVTLKDGNLYQVQGERLAPLVDVTDYRVKDGAKTAAREAQLGALIEMRRAYGSLIDAEREGAADMEAKRTALREIYDAFVDAHGTIGDSDGLAILKRVRDPFYPSLAALERADGKPAAIMVRSTTRARRRMDNPSVRDAMVLARNEAIDLNMERIAEIAKVTPEAAAKELIEAGAVFRTPVGTYEPSDVYLSGNVRRKIREAQAAADQGEDMARNIEALSKVVPKDIPYFNIEAKFGATWIRPEQYRDFVASLLGIPANESMVVRWTVNRWRVLFTDRALNARPEATTTWGHSSVRFDKLLTSAMGNVAVKVTYRDSDGNLQTDEKASAEANDKAMKIREQFATWLWSDPVRRIEMEQTFNEVMNAVALPKYDGSFLNFDGMAIQRGDSPFNLRKHQVDAIWRGLANGRSINAHEVGTGKTYTMGGLVVESRRYGLAKKPIIFAHNANSASVAREIGEMYPGAKLLYIDNLAPERIATTLRQIANDDWDAIIVPHSLIDRFTLKRETLEEMQREQIDALEQEAIEAAKEDGSSLTVGQMDDEKAMQKVRSVTAKQLVHARNAIIKKIDEMALRSSREDAISFEDMGIDMVVVDEAHEFKKPPITTRMQMKGLNTQSSAQSISMQFLTDYVKKLNGGRGVHTFTGTPITNTMNEIYNQMRFVMDDQMARDGVRDWDAWFNTFADSTSDVELTAAGEYEPVTRLASFVNVAELRRMIGQYMDIVFADDMPEFKPRATDSGKTLADKSLTDAERNQLLNGRSEDPQGRPYKKVITDIAEMTGAQAKILAELQRLSTMFKNASKKDRRDLMLAGHPSSPVIVETNAANAGLDARLYDMSAADDPNAKVNRAATNIMKHYNEHPKATQVVFVERGFSDASVSRKKDRATGTVVTTKKARFNLVRELVDKLVAAGIPEHQIAIVDGSTNKEKRKATADAMNRADIRVVIGNTKTLGVGVNMQTNLRAMHHLDAPWMPGELEQRNGRGHRQGNQWNTVLEYRYLTERIDGRRWQVLAVKDRFIKAFLRADDSVRVIDGDAVSMDEEGDIGSTLADAAGDPRLMLMNKVKGDVTKLETKERMHSQGVFDANRMVKELKKDIEDDTATVAKLESDSTKFRAAVKGDLSVKIGSKTFTDIESANAALLAQVAGLEPGSGGREIGEAWGFTITATLPYRGADVRYAIAGQMTYAMGKPTVESARQTLYGISNRIADVKSRMSAAADSIPRMEEASKAPFAREKDLEKKRQMFADLESDIQANPVPAPSWLRSGAPANTEVYIDGKPAVVEGHRWTNDGFLLTVSQGDTTRDIDYTDAKDVNGLPVYEAREFAPPKVNASQAAQNAVQQSAQSGAKFSRGTDRPVTARDGPLRTANARVSAQVDRIKATWPNAPEIIVIDSMADAPADVQANDAAQRSGGAKGDPEGFWSAGKVYLVASALETDADVERVLAHEVLGHAGLRGAFGVKVLGDILEQLAAARPADIKAKLDEYGLKNTPAMRMVAAEEVLATLAQTQPDLGFVRRAIAAIRTWLRARGLNVRLTNDEIIRNYILPARQFVQGQRSGTPVAGLPRFSRDQEKTAAFKAWFGDSKVVDEQGRPLVVYHGTSSRFTTFAKGDIGFHFGTKSQAKARASDVMMPVYLSIQRPLRMADMGDDWGMPSRMAGELSLMGTISTDEATRIEAHGEGMPAQQRHDAQLAMVRSAIRQAGYDGVVYANEHESDDGYGDGQDSYIAFSPAQIKSATGNNGAFDPANPDIRFSRKKATEQARETFADMMQSTKAFNWWNKSIGTQYQKAQQNTTFRAVYNRVQDYIQDISDFGSRAAGQAPTLLPRLDKIRDVLKKPVSAADQKAIAAALYGGTLAGESVTDGRLWSDDELRTQFKLTDPQIALYREARAAIDQSIDDLGRTEIAKLVGDTVDPMFAQQAREAGSMADASETLQAGLDEKIDEARQVDSEEAQRKVAHLRSLRRAVRAQTKRVNELKDAGYMPLMRFGKYAVNVPDPDVEGESLHFALFDSERLANAHARELRNDPQFAGKQITQGIISDRAAQLMQGVDPATLEIFAEAIGASESEVFQEYLKLVTSQRSAMKRLIERKGTPGYSEDIKRTLASFITSNARAASGNMHLRDLLLNTSKIKEGDVKDEAIGLVKHVLDPQPDPSAKARSLLFMQFIGGSVASALVNLTQPVTMTLPYLSQYSSLGHAANLLRKATMAAVRGVTGAEAEALKRAERDGIVSPQEIHFLYGEAEKAFGSNPLLQRAGFLWGAPFGLAEQFNRRATFIAAYRLGVERNEANPFAFAEKAVIETQGVYNRGNASNWARNPVGGALLTFKQFSVAYLELLKRLPNRERAIALAILALASGMEGLPGADDLDDILDTFAQAFGYNWSSKQAKREFITATLGPEMAQFTTRGVSAFLPMDISARMGLGNLLPGTGLLMQSRQDKGREVAEVFGAPGGAVQMVGKAATQAMAGEPLGAVSAVLPVALQNLLDPNRGALAMATAGQYKDDRGRRVVDVDALDALMKAAGFNPVNVAEPQMAMRIAKQSIDLARAVESEIAGDLAAARVESDSTRAASARARLADWNAKNPDTPIRIEESQIRRRAREMQTTKADRLTRTAPREMRAGIRRQVEAVDE